MLSSIKQYVTALGKWGFAVIVLLIGDIFGIVQSYISSEAGNFILPVWAWWLVLVCILILSPFWAFHKMRLRAVDLTSEINRITDTRPSIIVEPFKSGESFFLKVTNIGEQATFQTQITISEGDPSVYHLSSKPAYQGVWDNSAKCQAIIPKGHSASIRLAQLHSTPPQHNVTTWFLFFCDNSLQENKVATSSHIIGATVTDEHGHTSPLQPAYKYALSVVISSNPTPREGIFHGDYMLSYEHGLEQSTAHKAGSQN